ncbi:hypothetical protein SAMN05192561_11012 [Halopenitus malekzadehii]|uniref:Lipoprotein n=1 Tax=Halopenitus malekzadehii TaxID=1267564 RepID=A0A1H6JJ29_9EURY|nr:hypothetical protein [Halopenitus malekzadehii]SEH58979.1 hypothetical protein SAMN05192561_11012 [Halopenitus malekzadehii]
MRRRISRRALLGTLGSIALGGCLSGGDRATPTPAPDTDGDGVPDHGDDYPTDDRRAVRTFRSTGAPTLQPGEFTAIAITNAPTARGDVLHYEVTVAGSTPVDCLVLERDAYDAYIEGARDVRIVNEYSRIGVREAEMTVELDRGEYLFVLDHTALKTDPGSNPVTVEHVVEIAEPAPTTKAEPK